MEPSTRGLPRRRWIAAGLTAGALLGAVVGAGVLTRAAPEEAGTVPRPAVLHAAPAFVQAGAPLDLTVTTYCQRAGAPSCRVVRADVLVRPSGLPGAVPIQGRSTDGVIRFHVPADLVPDAGLSYAFRLETADGATTDYPPGGEDSPIRVLTTRGLPRVDLPGIRWDRVVEPSETMLRLRAGSGPTDVGVAGVGDEGGQSGPSSFDVATDGSIVVADWVHARALRFGPDGSAHGSVALPPGRPLDIAIDGRGLLATTLGTEAQTFEVTEDGEVAGRYPVGYGVVSRVIGGPVPRVRVGSAQWVPVRGPSGAALPPGAQAAAQTSSVPLVDGSVAATAVVDDRLAVVWTRPDGSRAGAAVRLPEGVQPGADYFVRSLADGGALAVQGVWDATHFAVAAIRFDARGSIASLTLLPEPTARMAAPFSTVRSAGPRAVLMARDLGDGIRIDRFEVR